MALSPSPSPTARDQITVLVCVRRANLLWERAMPAHRSPSFGPPPSGVYFHWGGIWNHNGTVTITITNTTTGTGVGTCARGHRTVGALYCQAQCLLAHSPLVDPPASGVYFDGLDKGQANTITTPARTSGGPLTMTRRNWRGEGNCRVLPTPLFLCLFRPSLQETSLPDCASGRLVCPPQTPASSIGYA